MAVVVSDARRLYVAVAESYDGNNALARIPARTQRRLERAFRGVELPSRVRERDAFLRAFQRVARKQPVDAIVRMMNERRDAGESQRERAYFESNVEILLRECRVAAEASLRARRAVDYMRFLGRSNFEVKNVVKFVRNAPFFLGRGVKWSGISKTARDARESLERLAGTASDEVISELVGVLRGVQSFRDTGVYYRTHEIFSAAAFLMWRSKKEAANVARRVARVMKKRHADMCRIRSGNSCEARDLLSDVLDCEPLLNHARKLLLEVGLWLNLYDGRVRLSRVCSVFSSGDLNGYVIVPPETRYWKRFAGHAFGTDFVVASENARLVQHELQHVFDKLACVSQGMSDVEREYTATLGEINFEICSDGSITPSNARVLLELVSVPSEPHERARCIIVERLMDGRTNVRKLLERHYEEACGLRYSDILEPFKR